MQLITHDELKQKLDSGQPFKLVMTLHETLYQPAHIPTSINIYQIEDALEHLSPEDEICVAGVRAYHLLWEYGYEHVRRYAGGLADWSKGRSLPLGKL